MSSIAGTRRADIAIPVSGVLAATAIGIGVAILDPQLAGSTPPHPTLTGSLGDAVWVLQNNARVLAVPFLLVAFGFPQRRLSRRAGDLIVPALVTASAIPVGLELGRWGARLVPYLPQLPARVGGSGALGPRLGARAPRSRDHSPARPACGDRARAACRRRGARGLGHPSPTRSPPDHAYTTSLRAEALIAPLASCVEAGVGCLPPDCHRPRGRVASRSHAPFPSLRSVPLGRPVGVPGFVNHRIPTRREPKMSASAPAVNSVTLVGNLTADPVLKQLGDDRRVCNLRDRGQRPEGPAAAVHRRRDLRRAGRRLREATSPRGARSRSSAASSTASGTTTAPAVRSTTSSAASSSADVRTTATSPPRPTTRARRPPTSNSANGAPATSAAGAQAVPPPHWSHP